VHTSVSLAGTSGPLLGEILAEVQICADKPPPPPPYDYEAVDCAEGVARVVVDLELVLLSRRVNSGSISATWAGEGCGCVEPKRPSTGHAMPPETIEHREPSCSTGSGV